MAKAFAAPEHNRLIDFLSGAAAAHFGGHADEETGLEICGLLRGLPNLSVGLGRGRLRALLDQLTDRCDSVAIDSPPAFGMWDSRLTSSIVDAVIFGVRWKVTSRDFVDDAIKQSRETNASIAGVVLSIVDIRGQKRYDYGDRN